MGKAFTLLGMVVLAAIAMPAGAGTVSDPTGDFLPSYTGMPFTDLDVTSFSVSYDTIATAFTLSATMAGVINPATAGLYVIGVNNGTATNAPFASIGEPNVIFNQAITIQKTGAAAIGATALTAATINDKSFTLVVPLSALTQSGFAPQTYGFNLWPRIGTGGGNAQISDFAPENALLTSVPEPGSWALMTAGFGLLGAAIRKGRRGFSIDLKASGIPNRS